MDDYFRQLTNFGFAVGSKFYIFRALSCCLLGKGRRSHLRIPGPNKPNAPLVSAWSRQGVREPIPENVVEYM
jgi:hypothetical protein